MQAITSIYSDATDLAALTDQHDFVAMVVDQSDLVDAFDLTHARAAQVIKELATLELQGVIDDYLRRRVPEILAELPAPYETVDFDDHTTGIELVKVADLVADSKTYSNLIFGVKKVDDGTFQVMILAGKRLSGRSKIDVSGLGQDEIDKLVSEAYDRDLLNTED